VLSNDNWVSVVVLGRYEEIPDALAYASERGKAQSLLEKRSMWWQTSYVASSIRGQSEASSPVFCCVAFTLRRSAVCAPRPKAVPSEFDDPASVKCRSS